MKVTLKVWRQQDPDSAGRFETYEANDLNPNMSFLEMLDVVNDNLTRAGDEPIAFAHDCREGICGTCCLTIDGRPHGPGHASASCQLYMRGFRDGAVVTIEPFRAAAFPVLKDLVVDRSAFDRIMQAGGFISVRVGAAPDGNALPISKHDADAAMDGASCIGCGACVAACKNSSAMLFVSAKVGQLGLLPQGQPERFERASKMVEQMDAEGFGACSVTGACEAVCPKSISLDFISRLNADYRKALFFGAAKKAGSESAG